MKISLCMPWRNRKHEAIVSLPTWIHQQPDELVIIDDGSEPSDEEFIRSVQPRFGKTQLVFERNVREVDDDGYQRYPLRAFNRCMEAATGDVLIQQSPEVAHLSTDLMLRLAQAVPDGGAAFARVLDAPRDLVWGTLSLDLADQTLGSLSGEPWTEEDAKIVQHDLPRFDGGWRLYTGHERPLPFFFCGAIHRKTWKEMGGYDESIDSTFDYGADAEFADRMLKEGRPIRGLGTALAVHIQHGRR